ncbi:proton-conducting membrane transporter [Aeromicrobium sp. A1-2]|uniref:NADH-quinone oxidoreductase subunit J family protein n=1 Tax=Aeromicrobium sp. A1-2 TaxID=2107713 RepID=UPI000E54A457|nr:NADH-quinone oxidoreductase subunit J [Aeromicrobium sp. A1-2]AXT83921.1 proton-conducting membrane transporter [Aeromicrobium sp. A1-2]
MSATEVIFLLFAAVAIGSALLAMTSRQLVHSALWLVVTLGAVAGCFVLLTAEFVAWVQVLVYVGSVVVLVIFALMLTRQQSTISAEVTSNRWTAAVLGLVASVGLGATVVSGFHGERIEGRRIGTAESIGDALFNDWVLPFEILSGVLLAALVGAIVISRAGADR